MKQQIKKIFPFSILLALFIEYYKDYMRFVRNSAIFAFIIGNEEKILGNIIADYHVIEKGLTMPEPRLGFGKVKIIKLAKHCEDFIKKYGYSNKQLRQAIVVLQEYRLYHKDKNFELESSLLDRIKALEGKIGNLIPSKQGRVTAEEYFKYRKDSFDKYAISRRSVRNYSDEDIPREALVNAVKIATTAPSSCNRQASRVYIYEDKEQIKEILEVQGANRGFGHLANKLVIVTAELGYSHGVYERNMPYVDGGIFAMNLLNGLHFNEIIACPLNCYFSVWKDKKLRKLCGIKKSEVFIVMISCGKAHDEFEIAQSYRYPVEEFITFK
jgi:nitroreductase